MIILAYILLAVFVLLLGFGAFLAFQRRGGSSSKGSDDSPSQKKEKEPKPEKKPSTAHDDHGHGHGGGWFLRWLKFLIIAFLAICLCWIVLTGRVGVILTYVGDEILHIIFDPAQAPRTHTGAQTGFAVNPRGTNALPDTACAPFAKGVVHTCIITEATTITQAPGTPAGLTFCWNPGVDSSDTSKDDRAYKKIERVLESGDTMDFDPDHLIDTPVVGYIFTPAKDRLVMSYWMTDSTCTAPVGK
jgi:hypothetical protein